MKSCMNKIRMNELITGAELVYAWIGLFLVGVVAGVALNEVSADSAGGV